MNKHGIILVLALVLAVSICACFVVVYATPLSVAHADAGQAIVAQVFYNNALQGDTKYATPGYSTTDYYLPYYNIYDANLNATMPCVVRTSGGTNYTVVRNRISGYPSNQYNNVFTFTVKPDNVSTYYRYVYEGSYMSGTSGEFYQRWARYYSSSLNGTYTYSRDMAPDELQFLFIERTVGNITYTLDVFKDNPVVQAIFRSDDFAPNLEPYAEPYVNAPTLLNGGYDGYDMNWIKIYECVNANSEHSHLRIEYTLRSDDVTTTLVYNNYVLEQTADGTYILILCAPASCISIDIRFVGKSQHSTYYYTDTSNTVVYDAVVNYDHLVDLMDAYDLGFYNGKNVGIATARENNLINMTFAVVQLPFKLLFGEWDDTTHTYVNGLFTLTIFGVDLRAFVLGITSAILILAIVRIILGMRGH